MSSQLSPWKNSSKPQFTCRIDMFGFSSLAFNFAITAEKNHSTKILESNVRLLFHLSCMSQFETKLSKTSKWQLKSKCMAMILIKVSLPGSSKMKISFKRSHESAPFVSVPVIMSQSDHGSALFTELGLAWGAKPIFHREHVNWDVPATGELVHICHHVHYPRYAMLHAASGVNVGEAAPFMSLSITRQWDGVWTNPLGILNIGFKKLRFSVELFAAQKLLCVFLFLGFLSNRLWVHNHPSRIGNAVGPRKIGVKQITFDGLHNHSKLEATLQPKRPWHRLWPSCSPPTRGVPTTIAPEVSRSQPLLPMKGK